MKRNTFKYIVLALLLAFVSRNETIAQEVNRSTARRVAETFLNQNVRGGRGASVQLRDITAETEFQNFYIFSADSGFVIVAADERVRPILGYSKTNRFVTEDMPENLRSWLMGYEEEIQYAKDRAISATPEINAKWTCLKSGEAEPMRGNRSEVLFLMTTKWDQNGSSCTLYNNACPITNSNNRCVTGCTATAIAQVLKYWRHPVQGIGSKTLSLNEMENLWGNELLHPECYPRTANFGATTYDWQNMPDQLTCSSSPEQKEAIATLMYHCGVAMHMNYGTASEGGSSAPYFADTIGKYFDYSPCAFTAHKANYSDNEWLDLLKAEIDSHRPVLYGGRSSGGGHAFILYGYDNDDNFLVNWGWSGRSDDYYAIGGLNPPVGGTGGGTTYDFNEANEAVLYLLPNDRTLSPPDNFNIYNTINFNELQLEWSAALHAESYVIMRNGKLLAETTSTSFLDNDIVGGGSYTYQVITIGENHRASIPSGSVTYTKPYTVTITTSPTEGGITTGDGHYPLGELCTVTATPNPGYIFKGWYTPAGLFPVNPLPTFTFTVSSNVHLIAKFQAAMPTTDIYQYYCWFDQDFSTVQTGSFQTVETFFSLDASALNEGLHTLHVMLDDNGLSAPKTYLFLKTPTVSPTSTYTYHCWFDQDYGTVQTGTFGGEGYSFALDANALEEGIHTVHVMLEGNDLSASKTYIFLKAPVASSTETYTYHCWFDQDYETVQTGSFGGEGYSFALDASELDEGIHTMHVMLEGSELTAAKTYLFLKAPVASPTSTYTYHCWFDNDYGTVQTGTFGGEGYSFALDVDGLDNGLHFVNVMLEGNELSSAKRYLFCKKPIGGSGIYRWEYCLNGQWSDAVTTTLVPTVQTLDILTMLPVDHLPIRSEDFEFEPNGGQPEIYAKNTITFRFWDDENRFLDRSAVYVDATVHEPVVADWIQRNTTETIATPAANHTGCRGG